MNTLALVIPQGNSTVQINPPAGLPNGGLNTVTKVIGNSLTIMFIIAAILTVIFLILGGIQWIQSGGDKQKVAQARNRITYAIIGLVVALAGFFIINIVGYFFKVNLFGL